MLPSRSPPSQPPRREEVKVDASPPLPPLHTPAQINAFPYFVSPFSSWRADVSPTSADSSAAAAVLTQRRRRNNRPHIKNHHQHAKHQYSHSVSTCIASHSPSIDVYSSCSPSPSPRALSVRSSPSPSPLLPPLLSSPQGSPLHIGHISPTTTNTHQQHSHAHMRCASASGEMNDSPAASPHFSSSNEQIRQMFPLSFRSTTQPVSHRLYPPSFSSSLPVHSSSLLLSCRDSHLRVCVSPYSPRRLPPTLTVTHPATHQWIKQWTQEQQHTNKQFHNLTVWYDQVNSLLESSSWSSSSPYRTAVVCDLLQQLTAHIGRPAPVAVNILHQLFHSVYQGVDSVELYGTVRCCSCGIVGSCVCDVSDALAPSWQHWATHDAAALSPIDNGTNNILQQYVNLLPIYHPLSPLSDIHPPSSQLLQHIHTFSHLKLPSSEQCIQPQCIQTHENSTIKYQPPPAFYFRFYHQALELETKHDFFVKYDECEKELERHRLEVKRQLDSMVGNSSQTIENSNSKQENTASQLQPTSTHLPTLNEYTESFSSSPSLSSPSPPPLESALSVDPLLATAESSDHSQPSHASSRSLSPVPYRPPPPSTSVDAVDRGPVPSYISPSVQRQNLKLDKTLLQLLERRSNKKASTQTTLKAPPKPTPQQEQQQKIIEEARKEALNEHKQVKYAHSSSLSTTLSSSSSSTPHSSLSVHLPVDSLVLARAHPIISLSSASVSSLDSASMSSLLSEAISSNYNSQQAASLGTQAAAALEEANKLAQQTEKSESRGLSASSFDFTTLVSATVAASSSSALSPDATSAVCNAAFHTIHTLATSPPIPPSAQIAYFDMSTRLNMQYENLHRRIYVWALKQADLQKQIHTRGGTLTSVSKQLQYPILKLMFERWHCVVLQRRRQKNAFKRIFLSYRTHMHHLHQHFLHWSSNVYTKKRDQLKIACSELFETTVSLQSEVGKKKYLHQHVHDRLVILRAAHAGLIRDKEMTKQYLDTCVQQLKAVRNSNSINVIHTSIAIIKESLLNQWYELKEAKFGSNLQDPVKLLMNYGNLLVHVHKPYAHHAEGSYDWILARAAELQRCREKFAKMQDSDLLLCWINYHLIQNHIDINQEKIQCKKDCIPYRYDDYSPEAHPIPQYLRHFYSDPVSLCRRADNFTTSFRDSELIIRLMTRIAPHYAEPDILSYMDLETRAKKLLKSIANFNSDLSKLLQPIDIVHSFTPDLMAAFLGRLMMTLPHCPVDTSIFADHSPKPNLNAQAYKHVLEKKQSAQPSRPSTPLKTMQPTLNKADSSEVEADNKSAKDNEIVGLSAKAAKELNEIYEEIELEKSGTVDARDKDVELDLKRIEEEKEEEKMHYGPFTDVIRALNRVQRDLKRHEKVEPPSILAITEETKSILAKSRILLDDAYARHALWLELRQRIASFVSFIFSNQMRGEPITLTDRSVARQIKQYTRLINLKTGEMDTRLLDLMHPWNATSNEHIIKEKGKKKNVSSRSERGKYLLKRAQSQTSEVIAEGDEEDDDKEKDASDRRSRPTISIPRSKRFDDGDSSDTSSSDDDDDADDDVESHGGFRNQYGDDIILDFKELLPILAEQTLHASNAASATVHSHASGSSEASNNSQYASKLKKKNELQEDLMKELRFELSKIQEMQAKYFNSLRDIFRAYAQMPKYFTNSQHPSNPANVPSTPAALERSSSMNVSASFRSPSFTRSSSLSRSPQTPTTPGSSGSTPAANTQQFRSRGEEIAAARIAAAQQTILDANPAFTMQEFMALVKECRFPTRNFSIKKIERVYQHVWYKENKQRLAKIADLQELHREKENMEIDYRQFVEILIRIAHKRMPTPKEREEIMDELEYDTNELAEKRRQELYETGKADYDQPNNANTPSVLGSINIQTHTQQQHVLDQATTANHSNDVSNPLNQTGASFSALFSPVPVANSIFEWGVPLSSTTRFGLALRFYCLLRCRLFSSAVKLNVSGFKSQYQKMEVSQLFKKYGSELRTLFDKYAQQHTTTGLKQINGIRAHWTNTIDYSEFIQLAKDAKWLDNKFVTLRQLFSIFANVQHGVKKLLQCSAESGYIDGMINSPVPTNVSLFTPGSLRRSMTIRRRTMSRDMTASLNRAHSTDPIQQSTSSVITNSAPSSPISNMAEQMKELEDNQNIVPLNLEESRTTVSKELTPLSPLPPLPSRSASATASPSPSLSPSPSTVHVDSTHIDAVQGVMHEMSQVSLLEAHEYHRQLLYSEFLEAITAIGVCRYPNPYIPLSKRLELFFVRDLVPFTEKHDKTWNTVQLPATLNRYGIESKQGK